MKNKLMICLAVMGSIVSHNVCLSHFQPLRQLIVLKPDFENYREFYELEHEFYNQANRASAAIKGFENYNGLTKGKDFLPRALKKFGLVLDLNAHSAGLKNALSCVKSCIQHPETLIVSEIIPAPAVPLCIQSSQAHPIVTEVFLNQLPATTILNKTGRSLPMSFLKNLNKRFGLAMATLGGMGTCYVYNNQSEAPDSTELTRAQKAQLAVKHAYDQTKSFIADHKVATGASTCAALALLGGLAYKNYHDAKNLEKTAQETATDETTADRSNHTISQAPVEAGDKVDTKQAIPFKSNYNKSCQPNISPR